MKTFLVLAGLAAALVAGAIVPYVRTHTTGSTDGGHCLAWGAGSVEFHENASGAPELGDAGFEAIGHALDTWSAQMQACGNLTLVRGTRSTSRNIGFSDQPGSNENLILFRTRACADVVPQDAPCRTSGGCANAFDCWDFATGILAITTTSFDPRTGRLFDADTEMNASQHTFTTAVGPPCEGTAVNSTCTSIDVQNTLTHELGHALGLAHSPDSRSTMFARAEVGETSKRLLDDGSQEFVCTVYPEGAASRDCNGLSLDLTGATGSCSAAPVGLLALAAAAFRRRGET